MAAEKSPAFQFYPRDFVSDGRVEAMSTEEVGAYILLLCKAWHEEPTGSLPNDDRTLARWARVSVTRWKKIRDKVLAPFTLGEGGRLHQKRMQEVAAEQEAYRQRLENRAKKGAAARWSSDAKAMPKDMLNHAPSSATATAPSPADEKIVIGESASRDDVENWVSHVMRLANRGMIDAEIEFNPILGTHASRQRVFDWLQAGISHDTIEQTVFQVAKAAKKQISSMAYFDKAVRAAHETGISARVEIPEGSEAHAVKQKGVAANYPKDSAARTDRLTGPGEQPEPDDSFQVAVWKRDHQAELAQMRIEAEAKAAEKSGSAWGMIGTRTRQKMTDGIVDEMIREQLKLKAS